MIPRLWWGWRVLPCDGVRMRWGGGGCCRGCRGLAVMPVLRWQPGSRAAAGSAAPGASPAPLRGWQRGEHRGAERAHFRPELLGAGRGPWAGPAAATCPALPAAPPRSHGRRRGCLYRGRAGGGGGGGGGRRKAAAAALGRSLSTVRQHIQPAAAAVLPQRRAARLGSAR